MKLRCFLPLLAFGAWVALAGCFSIDVATNRVTHDRHVLVSSYGWYLFGKFPLVCGNIAAGRLSPFAFFRDDVTLDKTQSRFMDYARKERLAPRDMTYHTNDQVLFTIPGSTISFPLPYFITYREIQLSGVLQ